jgi:hypothetical protein
VVVNMHGMALADRPALFAKLMVEIGGLRASVGRPHWLFIDEAHHMLPAPRADTKAFLPEGMCDAVFITVHPEAIAPSALAAIDCAMAIGGTAEETLAAFAKAAGENPPKLERAPKDGEVAVWQRSSGMPPRIVKAGQPKQDRKRHSRKYAEGELGEDNSFYFRGPKGAMNLRAQNLMLFQQIAEGIDDETWMHHLRAGDYSRWFRDKIKDEGLAAEAENIERDRALGPRESRRHIVDAVTRRYTAPATAK